MVIPFVAGMGRDENCRWMKFLIYLVKFELNSSFDMDNLEDSVSSLKDPCASKVRTIVIFSHMKSIQNWKPYFQQSKKPKRWTTSVFTTFLKLSSTL